MGRGLAGALKGNVLVGKGYLTDYAFTFDGVNTTYVDYNTLNFGGAWTFSFFARWDAF